MPTVTGIPGVPLLTPPASITLPVVLPLITAASLAPLMVMVTSCAVPSTVVTVKVSVRVCPTLSACTVALLLLSVGVEIATAVERCALPKP